MFGATFAALLSIGLWQPPTAADLDQFPPTWFLEQEMAFARLRQDYLKGVQQLGGYPAELASCELQRLNPAIATWQWLLECRYYPDSTIFDQSAVLFRRYLGPVAYKLRELPPLVSTRFFGRID